MTTEYKVVFTPQSQEQLELLYDYISDQSGEDRAEDFVGGIIAECLSLRSFPERGTKRDDIRPNLRTMGYERRVTIAFSVHPEERMVAVHGVFYGGRNFEHILRDD